MTASCPLPDGVQVFERGWLSANNILLTGDGPTALVDSGYWTHASQTIGLVTHALRERPLEILVNTHLHSDHCGGNAALQEKFPGLTTLIPPGHWQQVHHWDPVALTYEPTGQHCPRFRAEQVIAPGSEYELGAQVWQAHAAPGHDPHSIVLFEPQSRTLVSADSLWENGFGVVFPELEGQAAFDEVGQTLDLIESLQPAVVIPGHGQVFSGVAPALAAARKRLDGFVAAPAKHARHSAKVLLKFKLLEVQAFSREALHHWAANTVYLTLIRHRWDPEVTASGWIELLADDLVRACVARREGEQLINIS